MTDVSLGFRYRSAQSLCRCILSCLEHNLKVCCSLTCWFHRNNILGFWRSCIFYTHQQSINLCHMASTVGILIQFIFSSQKCSVAPCLSLLPPAVISPQNETRVAMNNSADISLLVFIGGDSEPRLYIWPYCTHTHTHRWWRAVSTLCRLMRLLVSRHCQRTDTSPV